MIDDYNGGRCVACSRRTNRWTGVADPVGIEWKADWRPPGQLGRSDQDLGTLREQAATTIPEAKQECMTGLLMKNREGQLSDEERAELDAFAKEFDAATLIKCRALSILAQVDRYDSSRAS